MKESDKFKRTDLTRLSDTVIKNSTNFHNCLVQGSFCFLLNLPPRSLTPSPIRIHNRWEVLKQNYKKKKH